MGFDTLIGSVFNYMHENDGIFELQRISRKMSQGKVSLPHAATVV